MGYGGFHNLRAKIAGLVCDDLKEHYVYLDKGTWLKDAERGVFYKEYNLKLDGIQKKYKIPNAVLVFLYASDCDGKLTPFKCKKLYELIKDYDDDILYGYCGRPDCAKFKDFKELVKDCVDNKCFMEWY